MTTPVIFDFVAIAEGLREVEKSRDVPVDRSVTPENTYTTSWTYITPENRWMYTAPGETVDPYIACKPPEALSGENAD